MVIDQAASLWLDIGQVLFCMFMNRDGVGLEVHEVAKMKKANIQSSVPNKLGQ